MVPATDSSYSGDLMMTEIVFVLPDMLFTLAGFTGYLLTWMGSGQFGCSAGN